MRKQSTRKSHLATAERLLKHAYWSGPAESLTYHLPDGGHVVVANPDHDSANHALFKLHTYSHFAMRPVLDRETGEVKKGVRPINSRDAMLAAMSSNDWGRLKKMNRRRLADHLQAKVVESSGIEIKTTVYFTNARPKYELLDFVGSLYTLVFIDIDAHGEGDTKEAAWKLARHIAEEVLGGNCHIEPSTNGKGVHIYFVGQVTMIDGFTGKQELLQRITAPGKKDSIWPLSRSFADVLDGECEPSNNLKFCPTWKINRIYQHLMKVLHGYGTTITSQAVVDHVFSGRYPCSRPDGKGGKVFKCGQAAKVPRELGADAKFWSLTPIDTLELILQVESRFDPADVPRVKVAPRERKVRVTASVAVTAAGANVAGEAMLDQLEAAGAFRAFSEAAEQQWQARRVDPRSASRHFSCCWEVVKRLNIKTVDQMPCPELVLAFYERYYHKTDDGRDRLGAITAAMAHVRQKVTAGISDGATTWCDPHLLARVLNHLQSHPRKGDELSKVTLQPEHHPKAELGFDAKADSVMPDSAMLQSGEAKTTKHTPIYMLGEILSRVMERSNRAKYGYLLLGDVWAVLSVLKANNQQPMTVDFTCNKVTQMLANVGVKRKMDNKRLKETIDLLIESGAIALHRNYSTGLAHCPARGKTYRVLV